MRKYNNKSCSTAYNGRRYLFDSKAEMAHFIKLSQLLDKKKIAHLRLQPEFVIANAFKIGTNKTKSGKSKIGQLKYTPDFQYVEDGKNVVVEVKGMKTTAYTMRFKMFLAIAYSKYKIDTFIEVTKGIQTIYDCASVRNEF